MSDRIPVLRNPSLLISTVTSLFMELEKNQAHENDSNNHCDIIAKITNGDREYR
jgi:hypothetical protein